MSSGWMSWGAASAVALALVLMVWVLATPRSRVQAVRRLQGAPRSASPLTQVTAAVTRLIEKVVSRRTDSRRLTSALDRAGFRMDLADYILLSGSAALAAFALGYLLGGVLAAVLSALFAVAAAYLLVTVRIGKRKSDFADQLDDILQLLASNLRAGHSLNQSLDSLVKEIDEPAASELTRVVTQVRVGRDLGPALDEAAARMESDDFKWVAQAIAIHRQVGGNLAEVLDTVGETIRERNQIRRQVKALAAEGKLSAVILMGLPVAVALFLSVANPTYLAPMFSSLLGLIMLSVALVLLVIGGFWMRSIVTVKF